ncbi:MAG: hypothetical protein Q8L15_00360 [Methylobacter sp.]|nr:hypothetical protein [Methylobacter sp.]
MTSYSLLTQIPASELPIRQRNTAEIAAGTVAMVIKCVFANIMDTVRPIT